MTEASQMLIEPSPPSLDAGRQPLAHIDLDRFCEGCGYNLRTLPVHRDERLGIPVVRCPECGRFISANDASSALRPWLRRLTALMLGVWMLAIVAVFVLLGSAEASLSYVTLDELTTPGDYTIQRIGNTVIRTRSSLGPMKVDQNYEEYRLFITTIMICSLLSGFACGTFGVVFLPHWPRLAYVGIVLSMPLVLGALIALSWHYQAPHLFDWGLPYVAAHAGVQVLGGLLGVACGRPFTRLVIRSLLPPSLRPRLAYLWLIDGKPLPHC